MHGPKSMKTPSPSSGAEAAPARRSAAARAARGCVRVLLRAFLLLLALAAVPASAQEADGILAADPTGGLEKAATATAATDDLSAPVKIVLVLTVLALAPAILMTVTSFTRIIIVLSFVRKALSVPEMPPNQVLIGLSLFLTVVVMNPLITTVNEKALQPYLEERMTLKDAAALAAGELAGFLRGQTREDDIVLMIDVTGAAPPETAEDVPLHLLVPAFALSELRTAFQMGFVIYLPFLVVDLVVASVLLSMGMFMLPPVIISTPFKILLFILVDGWDLVVRSVIQSFQAA